MHRCSTGCTASLSKDGRTVQTELLKFFRDPAWQVVGVLVAIVAIFATVAVTGTKQENKAELSIVYLYHVQLSGLLFPTNRIQILAGKSTENPANLVVDYFMIYNSSSKPLQSTDFIEGLSLTNAKGTKPLIAVESCSSELSTVGVQAGIQSCSPNVITLLPMDWVEKNGKWIATPVLMNPKDTSCILAVSPKEENSAGAFSKRFSWNARVAGVNLRTYDSPSDYQNRITPPGWEQYLTISVVLIGLAGIIGFLFLQIAFITLTGYLAMASGWISGARKRDIGRFVILAILATSTAEILVDIFINHRPLRDLHPVCWPLLIAQIALCTYLVHLNYRHRAFPK